MLASSKNVIFTYGLYASLSIASACQKFEGVAKLSPYVFF